MSYTFAEAEPVTIQGTGKKKAENPFTDAVAGIAWQTNEATGKPKALSFVEEIVQGERDSLDDAVKATVSRIRRFMRDAGTALETPGTVRISTKFTEDKGGKSGKLAVTFWVTKLVERKSEK